MYSNKKKSQKGFTLIEIVISITILAVITTITYSSLQKLIIIKNILDDRRTTTTLASGLLNRISKEIAQAVSRSGAATSLISSPTDPNPLPSGVSFFGEERQVDTVNYGDRIVFAAYEVGQYVLGADRHSGVVQISYRVEEDTEHTYEPGQERYVLLREEIPLITPPADAYEQAIIFPIAHDIVSLQFRYYSKRTGEWATSWGVGSTDPLPNKLQIFLAIRAPSGSVAKYTTVVPIR